MQLQQIKRFQRNNPNLGIFLLMLVDDGFEKGFEK